MRGFVVRWPALVLTVDVPTFHWFVDPLVHRIFLLVLNLPGLYVLY